jgi:hypothetical protein
VGAILLVLLRTSGGDDAETAPAPPPAPPKAAPDPAKEARAQAERWYSEGFFDGNSRRRALPGRKVRELVAEAEKLGYADLPGFDWEGKKRQAYEHLLKREPDDPDANRAFGRVPLSDYPDFFAVFGRLADAKALPPDLAAFRAKWEERVRVLPEPRAPALEPDAFREAVLVLDRYAAFEKQMAENPTERAIFESLARIRLDPVLGQYETVRIEVPPYVLFYASQLLVPEDSSPRETARVTLVQERFRGRLRSFESLIRDYLAHFRETYMKPLGLDDFAKEQLFFVWMFDSREGFDAYGEKMRLVTPPGLLGYFNPQDHWVFLYEDPENRIRVETTLAHELTHQLHWHFSKVGGSTVDTHFRDLNAVWLSEGWAEYVGWCAKGSDGRFRFAQEAPERLDLFRACLEAKLPVFPLRELVQRESYSEWLRAVLIDWLPTKIKLASPNTTPAVLGEIYLSMLYSESWLFVRFLHEYEGGRYRAKTLEFLKATLGGYRGRRGEHGYARAHEAFAQIFGLATDADWERMQKEFDGYLEKKLQEVPAGK